jgi:hypothetical protein
MGGINRGAILVSLAYSIDVLIKLQLIPTKSLGKAKCPNSNYRFEPGLQLSCPEVLPDQQLPPILRAGLGAATLVLINDSYWLCKQFACTAFVLILY